MISKSVNNFDSFLNSTASIWLSIGSSTRVMHVGFSNVTCPNEYRLRRAQWQHHLPEESVLFTLCVQPTALPLNWSCLLIISTLDRALVVLWTFKIIPCGLLPILYYSPKAPRGKISPHRKMAVAMALYCFMKKFTFPNEWGVLNFQLPSSRMFYLLQYQST